MPKPISADLPADELIARVADSDENDSWQAARPWLIGRGALPAAREILAAAAAATPAQRIAAVEIVDALGEPAQAAWRDVTTVPNLGAHARMALAGWRRPQASSPEDSAWLAVEYAVAALTDSGPDEALSCIDERIAGQDLSSRLQAIRRGNHPDTATLAEALTTFVASGATPTSSQVYQLKISLKRMRNPIWRRVLVPATARLGLLHQVIQIVMNWGGDHLHAFFVGNEHYGDPFNSPDLDDEESLRLSGTFTPSIKTITYLYDFGASWYHDITYERVLDLEVDATYPVCVTGRGDFPIEYWNDEDDNQEPIPFDKDKVNIRLAELARHSN
ncbi:MAG: plasmid pRiA4b ORF-3 family protein [Pseudonocardiaceae bacterium]